MSSRLVAAEGDDSLTDFVAGLFRLRLTTPAFHRRRFFAEGEIVWRRPDGEPMTPEDWNDSVAHAVAVTGPGARYTLLVNAWWDPLSFHLPAEIRGGPVCALVDTSRDGAAARDLGPVEEVVVAGRSLVLLERPAAITS
jgi:pullulanase/glycogen debranching enzyme